MTFWGILFETIRIVCSSKLIYQVEFDFGISSCSGLLITFWFVARCAKFITYMTLRLSQLVHVTIRSYVVQ